MSGVDAHDRCTWRHATGDLEVSFASKDVLYWNLSHKPSQQPGLGKIIAASPETILTMNKSFQSQL